MLERGPDHHDAALEPMLDWSQLLAATTPHELLDRLGRLFQPDVERLELFDETGSVAHWELTTSDAGAMVHEALIAGDPGWRLEARCQTHIDAFVLIERAVMAIEAWRSAQTDRDLAEQRVQARTRELDLIQALGRRAAEARDLDHLFRCAVQLLQDAEDIDVAVAAYSVGHRRRIVSFESRPVEGATRLELAQRATQLLGWPAEEITKPSLERLSSFDPQRAPLNEWNESSLVLLPVPRGERINACLVLLPARPAGEGSLRLCFAVSNQLSLHLDRILTVHEAEVDRFRSILDSMPQAVLLLDRQLQIRQSNPAAQSLMRQLQLRLGGSMREAIETIGFGELVDTVLRGETASAQGEFGSERDQIYSVSVSRLEQPGDGDAGLVVVLADTTEARRMQLQLAHSEKMSSLGRMISGVTHELNNPLTSIMGYAQLLRTAMPEGKVARRAEMLESEARRCQRIVRNLLSFARKRETQFSAVSLNEIVEAVVSLMRYQLRVESVELDVELSKDLPALHGDAHQLQQVFVNLLTNAQQAIREAEPSGRITIRTDGTADEAYVDVIDSGPGVPEAARARIFDPFFTTKEEGKGTGLGLSLVYGILHEHHGSIELRPSEGGAHFRVSLPIGKAASRQADAEDEATAPPQRSGRLLVVDDEEPIGKMICESLEESGHQTAYVANGREALALLQNESFDLVIADLRMPDLGGESLHAALCDLDAKLAETMLLTTGDTAGDAADEVARRTGCRVLTKPFDVDALNDAVLRRLDESS